MATRARTPTWSAKGRALTVSAVTGCARRTGARHARPAWRKLLVPVVIMVVLFLVWRYTPIADELTAKHVVQWAREIGKVSWSPLAVVAAYSVAVFVMFPRPLITLLAIIAYGPWLGFAISMAGIVGSALATYYAGRALPPDTLRKLGGAKLERTGKTLRKHGVLATVAVSIVPVAPFPLVGMTAGAARIKLWKFLTGVTVGMLPGTGATAVFTDHVLAALDDEADINYWLVAGILLVLIAIVFAVRRWLTQHR